MKADLLAAIDSLASQLSTLRSAVDSYVIDLPKPATPTGLAITGTSGTNPLSIRFTWDAIEEGCQPVFDYRGGPSNPSGPQEWTGLPINNGPPFDGHGSELFLQNPNDQTIEVRLRAVRIPDSQSSDPAALNFP